jgi:hypothetical protein
MVIGWSMESNLKIDIQSSGKFEFGLQSAREKPKLGFKTPAISVPQFGVEWREPLLAKYT